MSAGILVVEDDQLSRELLCDWLEMEGYEVRDAADLKSAFREIQCRPPDLVLLDVKLGGDDGLDLASWLRRQPAFSPIPVIAVTAHAMVTERERILEAGCNAWVAKPVDFRLLRETMRHWLSLRSLHTVPAHWEKH